MQEKVIEMLKDYEDDFKVLKDKDVELLVAMQDEESKLIEV